MEICATVATLMPLILLTPLRQTSALSQSHADALAPVAGLSVYTHPARHVHRPLRRHAQAAAQLASDSDFRSLPLADGTVRTSRRPNGLRSVGAFSFRRPGRLRRPARGSAVAHAQGRSVEALSVHELHGPLPDDPQALRQWARQAFDAVNKILFSGMVPSGGGIEIDSTWYDRRGGAGGAHPESGRIVLDPSRHASLRDFCGTLAHEMAHLLVGHGADGGEEHGPCFLDECARANQRALAAPGCVACCRLGEHDVAVDAAALAEAGVGDAEAVAALVGLNAEVLEKPVGATAAGVLSGVRPGGDWDEGLLLGDLMRALGVPTSLAAARLPAVCSLRAARAAMAAGPGGYDAWALRSRTIARHFAVRVGRDYWVFPHSYDELWGL